MATTTESSSKMIQEAMDAVSHVAMPALPSFLVKVCEILEGNHAEVVTWLPHGQSFRILDVKKFSSMVLSKYFKTANFNSFVRQLNFYGFRKIQCEVRSMCEFTHPKFRRDQPHLMHEIKRKTSAEYGASNNDSEVANLQHEVGELKMMVVTLTAQLNAAVNVLKQLAPPEVLEREGVSLEALSATITTKPLSKKKQGRAGKKAAGRGSRGGVAAKARKANQMKRRRLAESDASSDEEDHTPAGGEAKPNPTPATAFGATAVRVKKEKDADTTTAYSPLPDKLHHAMGRLDMGVDEADVADVASGDGAGAGEATSPASWDLSWLDQLSMNDSPAGGLAASTLMPPPLTRTTSGDSVGSVGMTRGFFAPSSRNSLMSPSSSHIPSFGTPSGLGNNNVGAGVLGVGASPSSGAGAGVGSDDVGAGSASNALLASLSVEQQQALAASLLVPAATATALLSAAHMHSMNMGHTLSA